MRSSLDSLYDFVAIGELADTTRQLLCLNLEHAVQVHGHTQGVDRVAQIVLQQARDYLSRVREGFVLSVRTSDVTSKAELGYLLERVLFDWSQLKKELGLTDESGQLHAHAGMNIERVRDQLMAFGMAIVALGALPRLPDEEVTFPVSQRQPPTYADIPVPQTPAEILQRIEELEEIIWQLAVSAPAEVVRRRYDPLRRTYGFFESSAWLTRRESRRFGVKTSTQAL
ncbi:MAG: hypothetical protein D6790_05675 [Caldilineae bacterium]|nr:MAG: hypothetical protein D6790_05675 [Caldilineae bacterium]